MVGQDAHYDISELLCKRCPLGKTNPCTKTGSLYEMWADTVDDGEVISSKCAGDIANIAWKEYKRLGG
jgi:hypothetical protein